MNKHFTFTEKGKAAFVQELTKVLKNPDEQNFQVWENEAEHKFNEHRASFEVSSQFTKSGNPFLIEMNMNWFSVKFFNEDDGE